MTPSDRGEDKAKKLQVSLTEDEANARWDALELTDEEQEKLYLEFDAAMAGASALIGRASSDEGVHRVVELLQKDDAFTVALTRVITGGGQETRVISPEAAWAFVALVVAATQD